MLLKKSFRTILPPQATFNRGFFEDNSLSYFNEALCPWMSQGNGPDSLGVRDRRDT